MLLNQISTGSGSDSAESLRSLAVSEFMAEWPLAQYAQFYSHSGNADTPRKNDADINGGGTRSISTTFTAKENTPAFGATALKIYGDMVQTDVAHKRRGIGDAAIGNQRAKDLANFARSMGRFFMDSVINDEIDATHFSGLKEQATALSRKVVFGGVNGGELPTGNAPADVKQQSKFFEEFNRQLRRTQGTKKVIVGNADFLARLESVGKNWVRTTMAKDIYGEEHEITTYRGVPIIDAGYKSNMTDFVIPSNEEEGTSTDCTSLYIVQFSEEMDVTFATNVGIDVQDVGLVGGTKLTTMFEFDIDLVVLNSKTLTQFAGIRLT